MESKNIIASTTFWGAVITVLSPFLDELGIDVGDKQTLVEAITGLFGFAMTVYGRIKAVKRVTVIK